MTTYPNPRLCSCLPNSPSDAEVEAVLRAMVRGRRQETVIELVTQPQCALHILTSYNLTVATIPFGGAEWAFLGPEFLRAPRPRWL